MRLDVFLMQQKLAASRTQAQEFITSGFVYLLKNESRQVLQKPSFDVSEDMSGRIFVDANPLQKYVSRAGIKLESALQYLKLDVKDKIVMDVGQSTGGFTDCLLQHGAARVVGIDVGHTQLHPSLQTNFKVVCIEDLNVKDLTHNELFLLNVPAKKFDMLVMDVSFISITKVIPFLPMFLSEGAEYLILVKPQYECGQVNLDRNGVVKNKSVYGLIESQVKSTAIQYFKNVEAYFQSGLTGRDGNQEFFIYGKNYI